MCAASEQTAAFQQLPLPSHYSVDRDGRELSGNAQFHCGQKFGPSLSSWQYQVLDHNHKLMLFRIVYLHVSATSDVPNCTITEIS